MFSSIFKIVDSNVLCFLICVFLGVILGMIIAAACNYKQEKGKGFTLTLILLPAIVCAIIVMVNGNIGAGIAVAGAFSLTRFRSQPGTAREITSIFATTAIGLILGMGFVGYAAIFTVIISTVLIVYAQLNSKKSTLASQNTLKVSVPSSLNYPVEFQEIFDSYLSSYKLKSAKIDDGDDEFKLNYEIEFKPDVNEKLFLDEILKKNNGKDISLSFKKENDESF